jgi:formylglycine-generating enzyme required for sulfatase activity
MFIFKSSFDRNLFISMLCLFAMAACGIDDDSHSGRSNGTGSYVAKLIFPADMPRQTSASQAIAGIDCKAANISALEFTFVAKGTPDGPYGFACLDHEARIAGITAGTGIRVDVYAYDDKHTKVLYGFEMIDIAVNQVTEGGEIEMKPVDGNPGQDQDGDGFSPPADCDDTNSDIHPDAPEIPGNNIDENCDGRVASPPVFTIDELGMTFVRIPAGTFMMGSPATELGRDEDEIQHEVTLTQAFYMQTTEVTQGQWQALMGQNPSSFQNCGDDCPVEHVSWGDIQEFVTRLNAQTTEGYTYRLPTEAEWEYAARAGSNTAFCEGDITEPYGNDPILNTLGWYGENSDAGYAGCDENDDGRCIGPQPVGGKIANEWGLFDMHGNVWEWCSDWYGEYPSGSVTDPLGPSSGDSRVLRGGSWYGTAAGCRSANRGRGLPGSRNNFNGFRLAAALVSR